LRFEKRQKYGTEPATSASMLTGQLEFLILPEAFKQQVCKGFRYEELSDELERLGFLERQKPSPCTKFQDSRALTAIGYFSFAVRSFGGTASE